MDCQLHGMVPTFNLCCPLHSIMHECWSSTSIVVFAVATGCLHGCVAASSSPSQLADAVPPIQVQGTPAIPIAQTRATFCKAKYSVKIWPFIVTMHTHTNTSYRIHSHSCTHSYMTHIHTNISLMLIPNTHLYIYISHRHTLYTHPRYIYMLKHTTHSHSHVYSNTLTLLYTI